MEQTSLRRREDIGLTGRCSGQRDAGQAQRRGPPFGTVEQQIEHRIGQHDIVRRQEGGGRPKVSRERLRAWWAATRIGAPRRGDQAALNADGDPATVFATLAERLGAEPLVLPDGQRVGYGELADFTLQNLYRPTDWAPRTEGDRRFRRHVPWPGGAGVVPFAASADTRSSR